ncbi:rhodanese-like domain-containing protein [Dehalobacterium formicoaceticum]|uniref:Rhodanese-like domain-containing protein n=1 Tax=Dehalobacterium formicoaceticum TaxID=51515 RepID=A0ABT1Y705_9FIRM|nr:rhodanese-like domain-containing protein [Dehalobacterium formicoaceticum]MCR6546648.1 rhodanese-like domain-containing protein [Dehalobacterium formicoaceticum]
MRIRMRIRNKINRHFLMIFCVMLLLSSGCAQKEENITFRGVIEDITENSILVTVTGDSTDFDKASVDISHAERKVQLSVGQGVEITILPEIRESYPVQVTGIEIRPINQKISAQEAKAMIDGEEEVIILDVRTRSEYQAGHIEGSVLLPNTEIKEKAAQVLPDQNAKILIYCRSGNRSAQAAKLLLEMGYTNVYDFGGIIDWPYGIVQ